MKTRVLWLLLYAVLLASCTAYQLPAGGYAFDVQIRIAPPVYTSTPVFVPTPDPTPTIEVTVIFDTPQPLTYITNTTTSTWNIRNEPSATSADLGDLKPGESIEYLFTVNVGAGWYGVQWEGGTAYVSSACCVDHG